MGTEHSPDTVWRAQELYCVDRLSFAKVAELTSVSATTLKAWGQKFKWAEKREEIAQAESDIRVNTIKGRQLALEMLLQSQDGKKASQMAFAVSSLENLAMKQQELLNAGKIGYMQTVTSPKLASREDAIHALREAVEKKLGLALSDPSQITTATVQDVKRCLDLVAELEASLPKQAEAKADKSKALSPENTQRIREILGV
ncbi:MAG: hypothetical protein R3Y11_07050 [Pseudomonadota bacterium]